MFQDNFLAEFQILKVSQLLKSDEKMRAILISTGIMPGVETIVLLDILLKTTILLQCL